MSNLLGEIGSSLQDSYAIVDLPPVLVGDDVVAMSSMLDCVLVVVEDGVTDKRDLRAALELLGGCEILGFVMNKCNAEDGNMGYGYGGSVYKETELRRDESLDTVQSDPTTAADNDSRNDRMNESA